MALFLDYNTTRPNRLEANKDEQYHTDFARWTLGGLQDIAHQKWTRKCIVNWSFYKGGDGQWIFEDDLENFFLDESGDIRNRLKMTKNLIKPMVQQYVGNAVRLSYTARAMGTSEFLINRREEKLAKIDFLHDVMDNMPDMVNAVEKDFGVQQGKREESKAIFENVFVDEYEKGINNLIKWTERDINIQDIKIQLAKSLSLNGVGVYFGYEQNGFYKGEYQDPMYWWFDRAAKKPDLTDAEYMGRWYFMDTPSLFEKYQNITTEERKALETYTSNSSANVSKVLDNYYQYSKNRVPVYECYWKDVEEQWYGWITDQFGYPYFTQIGKGTDYTDEDLIEPPTDAHKKLTKGKKKKKIFVDVLRYAIFVPKEEVGVSTAKGGDILLEWGKVPYQETYKLDPSNVKFPFKAYTWSYDKGEILTPLDDSIDPQRFINRLLSITESHINNARGTGTIIAKNAVDPRDGEESIIRNINKSKPVFVDITRTGSVQNSVGTYNSNIGQSAQALFQIMQHLQIGIQDVTGVNEAMVGSQGTSDALVGVVESQIQRGTLIQEPFYYALTQILEQAYNHIATVGKKIHVDNPRRLAIIMGDQQAEKIVISKDMQMEDFRVFVERSVPEQTKIAAGNDLIASLLQMQLLTPEDATDLFNRSTPETIANKMRRTMALRTEVADQDAQRQVETQAAIGQAEAAGGMQEQKNMVAGQAMQAQESQKDRDLEMAKIKERGEQQLKRDEIKQATKAMSK